MAKNIGLQGQETQPPQRRSITEVFAESRRQGFKEDQLAAASLRRLLAIPTPASAVDLIEAATVDAGIHDEQRTVNELRGMELSGEAVWTGKGWVVGQPPASI